tara:strand:- start:118 stop:744 length:627 start_codon:yes stop_codon:yes gene_type:complete
MKYLKHKPGSIEEIAAKMKPEDSDYQAKFKKELDKAGKGIASMTDKEKKDFFNKIDKMHKAKNEMTAAQKKLPPALQKAIKDKEQKEELNQDDKKVVTKVKDMLKKASQAHAGQAKELDKAMKTEADAKGNEINKGKLDRVKNDGEKKIVDPKPSLKAVAKTVKEMMRKKKDDVATMADTEKDKEKKTTLVGSKKTPVDTKPEVEYKN